MKGLKYLKYCLYSLTFISFAFFLESCENKKKINQKSDVDINPEKYSEPLINANKTFIRLEDGDIDFYIKRHNLQMTRSETGLRYNIIVKGEAYLPKEKDKVKIVYQTNLITGELIYSSKEDGNKEFEIGKTDEINGIQEGVKLIGKGGKAKLIIPSYLAYGVAGDGFMIRQRSPLVIEIELIDIIKPN